MKRFLYIFIVLLCSQVVWASKPIQIFVQLQAPHSPYLYEMFDESVDSGRKGHLISKTSVRTATSVFASGKFLVKLPDMASQMAAKMPKAKLWLRFRHLDDGLSKNLLKKLDDLPDGGHKFLDDFANAPDDILKKFLDNPELVEAWKVLDDAKVNAVLRKDPSWLNRVSNWTDEGLEVASGGKILRNGDEVGRIVGNRLHIKYTGYGGDIVCDATKTTTGIGKYSPPRDVGTKQIIDSKLSKSGESPGGINILNDTRNTQRWSDQKIWDEINEPWLRDAINRGDNIRAVSDPMNVENVFKATDNIPSSVLLSPEKLANYLKNLNDPNIIKDLSFYGREIRYLYQNNYLFDLTSKTFAR